MSKRGLRIIPRVEEPIAHFIKLTVYNGWSLEKAVGRDPATQTSGEFVCLVPDSNTWLFLIDDLFAGIKFFSVVGPDQERIATEVRRDLKFWTEPELFAWWDQGVENDDIDDRVDAVLHLGVNSPEKPQSEYRKRICAALEDPDKDVRNAAVAAAAYADWRVFRPDLERVLTADPDPKARERAQFVVDGWAGDDGAVG